MIEPTRALFTVLLLTVALGGAGTALAATERIDDFDNWSAYKSDEQGKTVCFMASEPTAAKGDYTSRGDIFALVSHRPGEGRRDEVSFVAGYTYQDGSSVEVNIGNQKYQLRNLAGDSAWTASPEEDKILVQAMIKGNTMTVLGTSSRGTLTTDVYSLKGFTAAYKAITSGCGL